jgi:U3 small nucleolar RNA-associated protein 20
MLSIFGTQVDFSKYFDSFWSHIAGSLEVLPEMSISNEGCPALLTLLQTMTNESSLISMLVAHDEAIVAIIKCISGSSPEPVISASLSSVENLLAVTNKDSQALGRESVNKHKMLLMQQFTARLGSGSESKSSQARALASTSKKPSTRSRTWKRELEVLMKISELLEGDTKVEGDYEEFAFSLCNLLLPFIHQVPWVVDEDKSNILSVIEPITRLLTVEESKQFYYNVADSLAPGKAGSGIKSLAVRRSIAAVLKNVAEVDNHMAVVATAVVKLCSIHPKLVDEMDFDTVIPQLNALGDESKAGFWGSMRSTKAFDPLILTPIINVCFNLLYSDDGVITRSSFNVLRALILVTSQQSGATASVISQWDKMIESVVVPMIKTGLQARNLQVRRYCILLLRVTTHGFFERQSSGLCGDLICLYDDENHDLDFFLSITHVQIHRRARSFQRLRKTLSLLKDGKIIPPIGQQSMSGFLLPLALHPIFESKSKTEEAFALDAIATVGAISRTLSWSKYNTTLWTLLNQFDRHPGQQKYMIGALCAMFDGFHFELVVAREAPDTDDAICKTSVWGALENRIIPKVEDLLVKESADRHGNKVKTLRPTIVLALLKLFQKFPRSFLEERLPRLLAVVCNALCNKDSSARDLARTTLAKMVVSMDLSYLPDVIRELAITLNEGYKLHVRAATVHSILLELSNVYEPILSSSPDGEMPVLLPFDDCVPALMDLIQQDLFGEANERRESSETNVRYVKEAGGSKSIHSVELISRMVCFTPSMVKTNGSSGVHGIVSPLLQRLQIQTIDAKTIKKVREILTRAIVGFSNNKSMTTDELLPFVFATLHPFTGSPNFQRSLDSASGDEYSVDENGYKPIKVSGSNRKDTTVSGPTTVKASVAAWQPSTLSSASSSRAAAELRREEGRKLRRVLDGASAPKLTGTMRHGTIDAIDSNIVNDPSAITAITFGLSLLNSSMKKVDLSNKKQLAPAINPFIPMLTSIVCHCRQTEVILLSLKCLTIIFEMHLDLPSTPSCSKSIGKQALSLLTSSGASMDKNRELLQACFRILTFLIDADSLSSNNSQRGEDTLSQSETLPLDQEQMKVLISLVQLSITDSDQHNPAIGLVKALMSRKFVSPEFYDLMESICKEVARSSKANLRQICSTIFVRFLLDYPMSEEKLEHHIKQVVANISYEYEDGRLSSQMMLFSVLEKLPNELIERHAQMFFLPLVLQLVNDESKQCRERVKKCVILLLTRSTMRTLQSFHAYCSRWSKEDGPLKVASLQIFGLVIESRGDFVRANQVDRELGLRILQNLQERTDSDWEVSYFSLLCVEKITQSTEGYFLDHADLMSRIVDCMMDAHPWIRLSSTRIISSIVASKYAIQILADQNGTLFQIVQQMCSQLNAKEDEYSEELSHISIKTLCTIVPLMATHSSLCYRRLAEEEEDQEEDESGKDPVFWMMRRLSQMCKNKGKKRRIGIFKLYAALSMQHFSIVGSHIELMLEGLHRSIVEATNEAETKAASDKRQKAPSASSSRGISTGNDEMTEHEIAENVLRQLEDICSSPDDFLKAYASVKRRAREKKMKRKSEEKAEAVKNPQAAVERTARKHGREKMRRKRRAEEHRSARGGEKKTRQSYI